MIGPMPPQPDLTEYRFALYSRSHLFGLGDTLDPPVALYRDERVARSHGGNLWPSTYLVIDLHGEDTP